MRDPCRSTMLAGAHTCPLGVFVRTTTTVPRDVLDDILSVCDASHDDMKFHCGSALLLRSSL